MSKRKKVWVFLCLIAFLCTAFIISFNFGMRKFNENKYSTLEHSPLSNNDKAASSSLQDDVVSPNAKVVLKMQYKKSGDIINGEIAASEVVGKNKQAIESLGYILESMNSSQVVLKKVIDSYPPNKYVLGTKDNYLAIFRTDDKGNMYIEDDKNDVTDIVVPTEGDYELLTKGSKDFLFNTKEEAQEKLGEYDS